MASGKGIIIGVYGPTKFEKDGKVWENVVISFEDRDNSSKAGALGTIAELIKIKKDVFFDTFKDVASCLGKSVYLGKDSYDKVNNIQILPDKK